ncbi:MAG: DNA methyltransferase [Deltaproteobacteria bacterium]|nr:DNA methyltransferase [Deltaproteobacteria bacterium]
MLSFPPHLVRNYVARFGLSPGATVLDPFCGTGTTLVECKKLGLESIGVERNPVAWFASRVKLNWKIDPDGLIAHAEEIAKFTTQQLRKEGLGDDSSLPLFAQRRSETPKLRSLSAGGVRLLLRDSISPLPLHKTLLLIENLQRDQTSQFNDHETLALAKTIVFDISNLHFGPEVGVGPPRPDADVVGCWLGRVRTMAADLEQLRKLPDVRSVVHLADARQVSASVRPLSVDAVITSPPYPNEKDYTRTTRLESVILGFIKDKGELRALKQQLVRSNTRSVYKRDDDDQLIPENSQIRRIAEEIERRRIQLGKTSGFERMYARVTKLYFGGIVRHLADLRKVLKPGAQLAYVVGDQASYLKVMIHTGRLFAELASALGYAVKDVDLFRTRFASASGELLREEVLILEWD